MMHGNSTAYREYEVRVGREILVPLLREWGWQPEGMRVLELGCAEAGLLDGFHEAGAVVAGVDVSESRAKDAQSMPSYPLTIYVADITKADLPERVGGTWDLIIFRDVIEHLDDKVQTMKNIRAMLAPTGKVFLETCPFYMPFGGHQQVLQSWMRAVPWLHLLPRSAYKNLLLRVSKQNPGLVDDLVEHTYDCGITMRALNRLIRNTGFIIEHEHLSLINPAYRIRFGLPTIRWPFTSRFPLLPEFAATSVSMLLAPKSA